MNLNCNFQKFANKAFLKNSIRYHTRSVRKEWGWFYLSPAGDEFWAGGYNWGKRFSVNGKKIKKVGKFKGMQVFSSGEMCLTPDGKYVVCPGPDSCYEFRDSRDLGKIVRTVWSPDLLVGGAVLQI